VTYVTELAKSSVKGFPLAARQSLRHDGGAVDPDVGRRINVA